MGQSTSQEISDSSTLNKSPEKKTGPPKLKVQPVPRPPSYAVPENKVLPSELPCKPLKAVSALSKSNPELDSLFVDKGDRPLENDNLNVDHNFFSDKIDTENNSLNLKQVKNRGKYQAPSPPVTSSPKVHGHKRTNSLDRLPMSNVKGQQKRPISAINLTSSEHTIFEDPDDHKNNSLPQKNTFPLDYSYAVTYAQLAGHRRKQFQAKLNSEKDRLLKPQSLPNLHESKMESDKNGFRLNGSEIDLDNTPKRKKYKAPPPPSPQISKSSIILTSRIPTNHSIPMSANTPTNHSISMSANTPTNHSTPKSANAPEEPPVDYDTGESSTKHISVSNGFTNGDLEHFSVSSKPLSNNIQIAEKEQPHREGPLVMHLQQSPFTARSPKSPPPVKPKPARTPDADMFMFPSTPVQVDTDIVTVNGHMIPESQTPGCAPKEVVSLSIDPVTERVAAAVLKESEIPASVDASTKVTQQIIISDQPPVTKTAKVAPIETVAPVTYSPKVYNNKRSEALNIDSAKIQTVLSESLTDNEGKDLKVKSVPLGFTTDIFVDTSEVNGGNQSGLTQSVIGSGAIMPLDDQSLESRTASDKSIELDSPVSVVPNEVLCPDHVNQSTMTIDLVNYEITKSLDRSMSASSSDSAKPVSPPLTPDTTSQHKMNSMLQNDIVEAAQVRVLKLKKPTTVQPPPKSPEDIFKEQLAKLHIEREERIHQNAEESPVVSVNQYPQSADKCHIDRSDNDSGIQACSFSEDWTPEHDLDLEDSDDEQRSVVTSRSGQYYEGMRPKSELKASNSFRPNDFSNGHPKILRKSDSDVSDKHKIGSLRRLKNNVHKGVQQVFNSKPSKKQPKLDKRSSLPVMSPSAPENKQPMFRRLDPDSVYNPSQESPNQETISDKKLQENGFNQSEGQKVMKKAGVAYVGGKGQIVLLPESEAMKADKIVTDDGHWAPKRWKKMKKFSYMATTRKKEKQKMEQLLQDRIAEQERKMEEERQKQLEMERKFMKVRQVDQSELEKISEQINHRKEMAHGSGASSRSTSIDESHDDYEQEHATMNGNVHGGIISNNIPNPVLPGYPIPPLIQAQNIQMAANHAQLNSMLLAQNQPYNPWLHAQPIQTLRYPASVGLGVPNYGAMAGQFSTASLPYDLSNYMQMLDINGQPVNIPVNGGFVNGYPWATQSLERRQANNQVQYNTPNYSMNSGIPVHQTTMLASNNYNNKRSLKQTANNGTIDDFVLNQMYDEYQNGARNPQTGISTEEKKRSNPLYYSSDEEEEYEVQDVHTGHRHSAGTVARISVPEHHSQHHSQDEEMPSPCSVTSSSADSGPTFSHSHYTSPDHRTDQSFTRNQGSHDGLNLDESYSSADR